MKYRQLIFLAMIALGITACSNRKPEKSKDVVQPINPEKNAPGDKMVYGLACEGCTDSVIVFLPNSGGDPVTFDILDAMRNHKVYGRPKIGDTVALLMDKEEKNACDMVIDLNELQGNWCYKVMPKMRPMAGMPPKMAKRMMKNMPDSMRQTFMKPLEYGITLSPQYIARTIGLKHESQQEDNMSPVIYPNAKRYSGWRLYNGKLLLISGGMKMPNSNKVMKETCDTTELMMMMRDSLVLRFNDHIQGYYRKANNAIR